MRRITTCFIAPILTLVLLGTLEGRRPLGTAPNPAGTAADPVVALAEARHQKLQWQLATVILKSERSFGSGALISAEGHVLTNYHVVEAVVQEAAVRGNAPSLQVILGEENRGTIRRRPGLWRAVVYRTDPLRDLALLKLTDLPRGTGDLPHFRLAPEAGYAGDRCYAVGSQGGGFAWAIRGGTVNATARYPEGITENLLGVSRPSLDLNRVRTTVTMSDCAISSGDSGGPLLNERGQLIGLTYATPMNLSMGSVGYHVALPEIRDFLKPFPARPEGVPFDSWNAGLPDAELAGMRPVDRDCDGRIDALMFGYAMADPNGGAQAAAAALYIDLAERRSSVDGAASTLRPRGLWPMETGPEFAFDLFIVQRHDGVLIIGYAGDLGEVEEIRIDWNADGRAEIAWVKTGSHWTSRRLEGRLPTLDEERFTDRQMRQIENLTGRAAANRQ